MKRRQSSLVPAYPSTHEQAVDKDLDGGIDLDRSNKARRFRSPFRRPDSQSSDARTCGRSVSDWACLAMEQILQEIDAAGQHRSQWTPGFIDDLNQAQRESVCERETGREREQASQQASKRGQVNQASDQTDLMTSAHGCS